MDLRPLIDDPGISDDDAVIRVIKPGQVDDGQIQSNAFEDYSEESAATFGLGGPCMSVNLRSVWLQNGASEADLLKDFDDGCVLSVISVGDLRRLKSATGEDISHGVMLDPREGRPWHCVVFATSGQRRSKGGKRSVSKVARLM